MGLLGPVSVVSLWTVILSPYFPIPSFLLCPHAKALLLLPRAIPYATFPNQHSLSCRHTQALALVPQASPGVHPLSCRSLAGQDSAGTLLRSDAGRMVEEARSAGAGLTGRKCAGVRQEGPGERRRAPGGEELCEVLPQCFPLLKRFPVMFLMLR